MARRRDFIMTSANVTYYKITEIATGKVVGSYSQHCLCKDSISAKLNSHRPANAFSILIEWPDEEEEIQTIYEGNLEDYFEHGNRTEQNMSTNTFFTGEHSTMLINMNYVVYAESEGPHGGDLSVFMINGTKLKLTHGNADMFRKRWRMLYVHKEESGI